MSNERAADTLSDYALEEVPSEGRKGLFEVFSVWVGWSISVSGFLVGGQVGAGLKIGSGILALLLGNAVLVVLGTLIGLIGYRTGLSTIMISRSVFGRQGSVIVALVLGIVAMGFIGVLMDAFGSSVATLLPGVPKILAIIVFAVLVGLTSIYGIRGLAVLSKIAAPVLWLLMAVAFVVVINQAGGFSQVLAAEPTNPISFGVGVGAAIATWVTGAALSSDITRFSAKPGYVFLGALGGYLLGAFLLEAVSAFTAAGVGSGDIVVVMSSLGLLLPAVLVLLIALWTTSDNNIYSSGLAFTSFGEIVGLKLSRPVWTFISLLIAVLTSLLGLASQFLVWLQFISTAIAPFAGVMVAHYWLVHKGKGVGPVVDGVRWVAFVAWIGATIFSRFYVGLVPALPAMAVAAVLYWILSAIVPSSTKDIQPAGAGR